MDKYIGRLLDNRYEILEVIGTGGMAVVYKARCHRLNRLVAIKILKDDYLQDEDFRRRFHVESQAVAMLSHPNIVSVYDVSTSIMADYIVMELIEGITLKQYMEKKGFLNWKETLHFAIQIAKALEHAHSRGIVHRDIKPHNVMVLKNGSVKVTDFGIARMMSKGNTLTKEALGSVHYISPEQAKGGRVDSRSDIYSLGVVMYEMMSGRPPYDGESPVSVAIQHINGGAVMPSVLNPNIPGGLEQIIMKAMAHELEDRYESATQMLRDMDEFRKDPVILFDYNTPPLDEVTKLRRSPLVLQSKPSTAERVAQNADGQRRKRSAAAVPVSGRANSASGERAREERRRREEQEREEESRSRVATIAIIICSLVAVIAIALFLVIMLGDGMVPQEKRVPVPDLLGKVYEDLPDYEDFDIISDEVYDDVVPAGQIIKQEPKANIEVVKGTRIVVTVSKGPTPQMITMPNLENNSEVDAQTKLSSLSLNLQIKPIRENSETIIEGYVTRTDPAVGTELTAGQEVKLYISSGPEIRTGNMPNLLSYEQEAAAKVLSNQELRLEIIVEKYHDPMVTKGCVIKTIPETGSKLTTGQQVTLYISLGPELATVPNMVGGNIITAMNLLKAAGFDTPDIRYVYSNEEVDTVVSQSHEKNTQINVDTLITLDVSKGPEPTQPPETTESTEVTETTEPTVMGVTMDVEINVGNYTQTSSCKVTVKRDGQIVFSGEVPQGVAVLVVDEQTGSGLVVYEVTVNDTETWNETVDFDE